MNPKVTFYDTDDERRFAQVAHLAEAAWARGRKLLIHSQAKDEVQALHDYLWTYTEASFLPHELLAPGEEPKDQDCRIALVSTEEDPIGADVLLMVTPTTFDFASRHAFVIDLVDHRSPELLKASRERFRSWREQGVQPVFKKA
jgi:DNA polymerase-3 subunit chi